MKLATSEFRDQAFTERESWILWQTWTQDPGLSAEAKPACI